MSKEKLSLTVLRGLKGSDLIPLKFKPKHTPFPEDLAVASKRRQKEALLRAKGISVINRDSDPDPAA